MAGSSASLTDLSQLIESLPLKDGEKGIQEALSSILRVDIPLDAGVEFAANAFATELGLGQETTLAQTAVFVVTNAAILKGAELIGIGGGLAKLDLVGFQMSQLMKQVEEINKTLPEAQRTQKLTP